ncbi:hypothetical protein BRPE67_BCDS10890 [Caballeronia cordobensis]|nr:hypothetical protein BRPE67_BCDS10890 [Burkholderia sp. RPE67]
MILTRLGKYTSHRSVAVAFCRGQSAVSEPKSVIGKYSPRRATNLDNRYRPRRSQREQATSMWVARAAISSRSMLPLAMSGPVIEALGSQIEDLRFVRFRSRHIGADVESSVWFGRFREVDCAVHQCFDRIGASPESAPRRSPNATRLAISRNSPEARYAFAAHSGGASPRFVQPCQRSRTRHSRAVPALAFERSRIPASEPDQPASSAARRPPNSGTYVTSL